MIRKVIIYVLIILTFLFGTVGFLLGTQSGLRASIKLAGWLLPGKLTVNISEGRLLSAFTLNNVFYQTETQQVAITKLQLDWQAWKIIAGHLPIKQFSLQNLNLYQKNRLGKPQAILELAQLNAQGRIGLIAKQPLQFEANWQGLQLQLAKQQQINNGQGRLSIQGTRAHYTWQLTGQLPSKTIPSSNWQLMGQGIQTRLILDQAMIKILGGQLTGKGWFDWRDKLGWNLVIQAQHLNPATQWADVSGDINFQLSLAGQANQTLVNTLQLDNLMGQLHAQPLTGKVLVKINGQNIETSTIQLKAGDALLAIEGELTQVWNLRWKINIAEVHKLIKHGNGSFRSMGTIQGLRNQPMLNIEAQGKELQIAHHFIHKLNAYGVISLDKTKASHFDLELDKASLATINVEHVELALRGSLAQQALKAKISTPTEQYVLTLTGQQLLDHWQIQIPTLTLKSERFGHWQLNTPLQATLAANQATLQPACWQTNRQKICLQQANWQGNHAWSLQLTGQNLELGMLKPWLPETIKLQGHADLNLAVKTQAKTTQLQANLAIGVLHLSYALDQQTTRNLIVHDIKASGLMNPQGLKTNLQAIVLDQPLTANFELPGYNQLDELDKTQAWRGQVNFVLNDLAILGALDPNITDVKGLLQLNLQLAGTIAEPSLSGRANLRQAGFSIPAFGTQIEQLQGTATGRADGKINYELTAQAGADSHLKLTGNADLFAKPFTSKSVLTGINALIVNNEQYQVTAEPELELLTQGPQLKLTGSIYIPKANLQPTNFSQQVIELPEDIVVIGKQPVTTGSVVPLVTEIKLKLSDKVHLDAKGLKGNIEGNLVIYDKPQQATTATGQLNVLNGSYNVYGENLTIHNGRLIFAGGNIDNPGLNIKASRSIKTSLLDEITVGVNAQGRLKQPKVTLFSEPANLSQADILSYILTGSPANQLSGAKGQLLFKAATALSPGSNQMGNLKKDLQTNLGLDELDVGTVQQYSKEKGAMVQNTSLILGKQLTPRLHIGYSMGIAEQINTFTVRFQLWRKLLLQTQTTLDNNSVDVIYTVERK
ncbi:MAG: translocation/assembly module TamB [Gammaproteobacteria bacterium]|jgi:translocation and assembly module TamB|nr:translocation/assembly module TamB [Gammaproteobacteria bacterium]